MKYLLFLTLAASFAAPVGAQDAPVGAQDAPVGAQDAPVGAQDETPVAENPTPEGAVPLLQVPDVANAGLADARLEAGRNEPVLNLESAVTMALQNNPTPKAARAALDAALARIGIARSAGGLQVGANGSINYQKSYGQQRAGSVTIPTGTGTGVTTVGGGGGSSSSSTTEQLGLNANFPIYTGGRVKAARRAAEAAAAAQLATTQQTEQELAAQTILAYLNVLQTGELLDVADSNLAVARERRRVSGVRFDAGAAARLEVTNADSDLAASLQRRVAAANNVAQSAAALNILMARTPETPVNLEPITALSLPAVARFPLAEQATSIATGGAIPPSSELRAEAGTELPSLAATREQVRAAEFNIDAQKAQKKPSIGLSLTGLLRNPAGFVGRFLLSAGASIAQTVFDSGRISSQVKEAQATAQQARLGLSGQQLQVANAIEGSLLSLDSALKRLASTETGIIAAQESLRSAQLGFEAGVLTPLNVTEAQNALLAAQTDGVNARFEVAQAQVQLAAATAVTQFGSATGRSGLGTSAGTGQSSTFSTSGANQNAGANTSTRSGTFGTNNNSTTFGTNNNSTGTTGGFGN